jgi:shikimate 5-dehydrogenase
MTDTPTKWCLIAEKCHEERFQMLSDFIKELGIENEFEFIRSDKDKLDLSLRQAYETVEVIRLGYPLHEALVEHSFYLPSHPIPEPAADAMKKDKNGWLPRLTMKEGFYKLFGSRIKNIDFEKAGLIVGTGCEAWSAVAGLAKYGFQTVSFTDRDEQAAAKFLENLEKAYFDIEFRLIPNAELSFLPGNHSVVVVTMNIKEGEDLFENLCNYNFLSPGGAVVDYPPYLAPAKYLKIAADVGAQVFPGYEVGVLHDFYWVKAMFGVELNAEQQERLRNLLKDKTMV